MAASASASPPHRASVPSRVRQLNAELRTPEGQQRLQAERDRRRQKRNQLLRLLRRRRTWLRHPLLATEITRTRRALTAPTRRKPGDDAYFDRKGQRIRVRAQWAPATLTRYDPDTGEDVAEMEVFPPTPSLSAPVVDSASAKSTPDALFSSEPARATAAQIRDTFAQLRRTRSAVERRATADDDDYSIEDQYEEAHAFDTSEEWREHWSTGCQCTFGYNTEQFGQCPRQRDIAELTAASPSAAPAGSAGPDTAAPLVRRSDSGQPLLEQPVYPAQLQRKVERARIKEPRLLADQELEEFVAWQLKRDRAKLEKRARKRALAAAEREKEMRPPKSGDGVYMRIQLPNGTRPPRRSSEAEAYLETLRVRHDDPNVHLLYKEWGSTEQWVHWAGPLSRAPPSPAFPSRRPDGYPDHLPPLDPLPAAAVASSAAAPPTSTANRSRRPTFSAAEAQPARPMSTSRRDAAAVASSAAHAASLALSSLSGDGLYVDHNNVLRTSGGVVVRRAPVSLGVNPSVSAEVRERQRAVRLQYTPPLEMRHMRRNAMNKDAFDHVHLAMLMAFLQIQEYGHTQVLCQDGKWWGLHPNTLVRAASPLQTRSGDLPCLGAERPDWRDRAPWQAARRHNGVEYTGPSESELDVWQVEIWAERESRGVARKHPLLDSIPLSPWDQLDEFYRAMPLHGTALQIDNGLSRVGEPIQFKVVATRHFSSGEPVTHYGGVPVHVGVFKEGGKAYGWPHTHVRSLPDSDFLLDGLPLSNMLTRPTPHTQDELDELLQAGVQSLQPTSRDWSDEELLRFDGAPFGFLVNTAGPGQKNNCRIHWASIAGGLALVPVLVASTEIREGEELLCPYNTLDQRRFRVSAATIRPRAQLPPAVQAATHSSSTAPKSTSAVLPAEPKSTPLRRLDVNVKPRSSGDAMLQKLRRIGVTLLDRPPMQHRWPRQTPEREQHMERELLKLRSEWSLLQSRKVWDDSWLQLRENGRAEQKERVAQELARVDHELRRLRQIEEQLAEWEQVAAYAAVTAAHREQEAMRIRLRTYLRDRLTATAHPLQRSGSAPIDPTTLAPAVSMRRSQSTPLSYAATRAAPTNRVNPAAAATSSVSAWLPPLGRLLLPAHALGPEIREWPHLEDQAAWSRLKHEWRRQDVQAEARWVLTCAPGQEQRPRPPLPLVHLSPPSSPLRPMRMLFQGDDSRTSRAVTEVLEQAPPVADAAVEPEPKKRKLTSDSAPDSSAAAASSNNGDGLLGSSGPLHDLASASLGGAAFSLSKRSARKRLYRPLYATRAARVSAPATGGVKKYRASYSSDDDPEETPITPCSPLSVHSAAASTPPTTPATSSDDTSPKRKCRLTRSSSSSTAD